jgi:hypothetical protein
METTKPHKCNICNDYYTTIHNEVQPGIFIYVCDNCLEVAKYMFIWICMSCGTVHMRPKKMVISRLKDYDLKKAYALCEDMQIIQGISECIKCDPKAIVRIMEEHQGREC